MANPLAATLESSLQIASAIARGEMEQTFEAGAIYVGNVDYTVTKEQLQSLFANCGVIKRVSIPINRRTGSPQGYAYINFEVDQSPDAVATAVGMDGLIEANGRMLKVSAKRVNLPGLKTRLPYTEGNEAKQSDPTMRKLSTVRLPGDWDCCACGVSNFSWREACHACGTPNMGGMRGFGGPMRRGMMPSMFGGMGMGMGMPRAPRAMQFSPYGAMQPRAPMGGFGGFAPRGMGGMGGYGAALGAVRSPMGGFGGMRFPRGPRAF